MKKTREKNKKKRGGTSISERDPGKKPLGVFFLDREYFFFLGAVSDPKKKNILNPNENLASISFGQKKRPKKIKKKNKYKL